MNKEDQQIQEDANTILLGKTKQIKVKLLKTESISDDLLARITSSKKFQDWCYEFDPSDLDVKSVKVDYVFMFGQNVGFVNLIVDCTTKIQHIKLPGFVFMRGKSVAILVIVNEKFMLLTKQFRVPVGQWMLETPAGMIDESGNFIGVAAKELKEETSISIDAGELNSLGSIFPSPGGCDEEILLYSVKKQLSEQTISDITSRIHGEEHEQINVIIKNLTIKEVLQTKDAKLIAAALAYIDLHPNSIQ